MEEIWIVTRKAESQHGVWGHKISLLLHVLLTKAASLLLQGISFSETDHLMGVQASSSSQRDFPKL